MFAPSVAGWYRGWERVMGEQNGSREGHFWVGSGKLGMDYAQEGVGLAATVFIES